MKVPTAPHFYFDVDNTLIHLLNKHDINNDDLIEIGINEFCNATGPYAAYDLYFNKQMVDLLLASHARGHIIVVWSAGGADWARTVANAIEKRWGKCVDFCLSKPTWWADDKTSEHVLPDVNRVIPTLPKGAL